MPFRSASLMPAGSASLLSRRHGHFVGQQQRCYCTTEASLTQQRHKQPRPLDAPRDLCIAVPDMHSQVNLSRIVRTAALFGVSDIIAAGKGRMDRDVSLGSENHVSLRTVRSLIHPLRRLKSDGWHVVGLEHRQAGRVGIEGARHRAERRRREGVLPQHSLSRVPIKSELFGRLRLGNQHGRRARAEHAVIFV